MNPPNSTRPLVLPCGTSATVQAFNGRVQALLAGEHDEPGKVKHLADQLLAEVVLSLGGHKTVGENHLLDLPSGSRTRLLLEARRLTYGDKVEVCAPCVRCAARGRDVECSRTVDLKLVDDVPYPEKLEPFELALSSGQRFTLGWGTGRTERAHLQARARKQVGSLDDALFRVQAVDGEPLGFLALVKLPGNVLDELRRAVRRSTPTLWLEGEEPEGAAALPVAGPRTRIQLACEGCGARQFAALEGAPDFLLHGLLEAAQD